MGNDGPEEGGDDHMIVADHYHDPIPRPPGIVPWDAAQRSRIELKARPTAADGDPIEARGIGARPSGLLSELRDQETVEDLPTPFQAGPEPSLFPIRLIRAAVEAEGRVVLPSGEIAGRRPRVILDGRPRVEHPGQLDDHENQKEKDRQGHGELQRPLGHSAHDSPSSAMRRKARLSVQTGENPAGDLPEDLLQRCGVRRVEIVAA